MEGLIILVVLALVGGVVILPIAAFVRSGQAVREAEHLRHTELNKQIYKQRKETIERVFADMKEKHGMRWTTLRGKRRVQMQAMLLFAAMNLKKLANWRWRNRRHRRFFNQFIKKPSASSIF